MMLLEVKLDLLVVLICLLFRTGVRKDSAGMTRRSASFDFFHPVDDPDGGLGGSAWRSWHLVTRGRGEGNSMEI